MGENNSFRKALEEIDLAKLTIRLGLYTQTRLARMYWRGDRNGPIPGGLEAADFVQAAFRKGLTQERIWKSSERSLFEFLKDIISSDISHLALKSENRVESRISMVAAEVDKDSVLAANLQGQRSEWPDAHLSHEQEQKYILAQVGKNELDQDVVRCVVERDLSVSGEIASMLNVAVTEVYKSKKRLRRKLQYLVSIRNDSADLLVTTVKSRNGEDQNEKI